MLKGHALKKIKAFLNALAGFLTKLRGNVALHFRAKKMNSFKLQVFISMRTRQLKMHS